MSEPLTALIDTVDALSDVEDYAQAMIAKHWGTKPLIESRHGSPTVSVKLAPLYFYDSSLIVRSEYITALQDTLLVRAGNPPQDVQHDNGPTDPISLTLSPEQVALLAAPTPNGGIIIRGSPSIGKTVFLDFLALVLMEHQVPFIFQYCAEYIHFICHKGFYTLTQLQFEKLTRRHNLDSVFWLFDCNYSSVRPWLKCLNHVFFVAAASSSDVGLRWTTKSRKHIYKWTMRPPSVDEALTCARLSGVDVTQAKTTLACFGPSMRLVQSLRNRRALVIHLNDLSQRLLLVGEATVGHIRGVILGYEGDRADFPEALFMTLPMDMRSLQTGTIITPFIANLINVSLVHAKIVTQAAFFNLCMYFMPDRSFSGLAFEGAMHERLPCTSPWPLRRLAKSDNTPGHFSMPDAALAPIDCSLMTSPSPSISGTVAQSSSVVPRLPVIIFTRSELESTSLAKKTAYYRSIAPRQASFDSFIYNAEANRLFVFHFVPFDELNAQKSGVEQLQAQFPDAEIDFIVVSAQLAVEITMEEGLVSLIENVYYCYVDSVDGLVSGQWEEYEKFPLDFHLVELPCTSE